MTDLFDRVYQTHRAAVRGWFVTRVDFATADDLTQDTFVKVLRAIDTARGDAHDVRPWVFAIAYNVLTDHFRRLARRPVASGNELALLDEPAPATDPAGQVADAAACRSALLSLSPAHREVMWLAAVEEHTYEEIATMIRIPVGTVKSRLFNARRLLAVTP